MTTATLALRANTQTYEDVKRLIYKIVHRFQRAHGGEWDELLSVANEGYLHAWERWDQNLGHRFSTYLYYCVRGYLLSDLNKRIRRAKAIPTVDVPMVREDSLTEMPLDQLPADPPTTPFDFAAYTNGFSEDVKTVMQLTLSVPSELARFSEAKTEISRTNRIKEAVCGVLRGLGWGSRRIAESFTEAGWAMVR